MYQRLQDSWKKEMAYGYGLILLHTCMKCPQNKKKININKYYKILMHQMMFLES